MCCGKGVMVRAPLAAWMQTQYVMAAVTRRVRVDAAGRVRWGGVWWYGVPWPVRVALWAWGWMMAREDAVTWRQMRMLPGCGCVVVLRDAWDAMRRATARVEEFAIAAWRRRACSLPGPSAAV